MADALSEITRLKYQELARALAQANIGQGIVGESAVWQSLNSGNLTAAQFNELVSSNAGYNAGFRAIGNADGTIRSYTYVGHNYPITEFTYDDIIGSFNSNVQSGTSAPSNTFTMQQPTNTAMTGAAGSETMKASGGVTKYTNGAASANPILTTMGSVVGAVMAAGTGIQLAKTIDGGLYHIGNALNLDPPESLNPATWNSITTGDDSAQAGLFNYIFGLNPDNGQITAYADENALAYMAGWLMKQGAFGSGNYEVQRLPEAEGFSTILTMPITIANANGSSWGQTVYPGQSRAELREHSYTIISATSEVYAIAVQNAAGSFRMYLFSDARFTVQITQKKTVISTGVVTTDSWNLTVDNTSYTFDGKRANTYYAQSAGYGGARLEYTSVPITISTNIASAGNASVALWLLKYGDVTHGGGVDGIDTQPDGTVPNTSGWDYTDPTNTILPSLQQQYPDLWNNRIENNVVQPDGSVKTYTYIPTQIPSGGNGTNADTHPPPHIPSRYILTYTITIFSFARRMYGNLQISIHRAAKINPAEAGPVVTRRSQILKWSVSPFALRL